MIEGSYGLASTTKASLVRAVRSVDGKAQMRVKGERRRLTMTLRLVNATKSSADGSSAKKRVMSGMMYL